MYDPPLFRHQNSRQTDFILILSQLRMKGQNPKVTNQRTVSAHGCQTDWKKSTEPENNC